MDSFHSHTTRIFTKTFENPWMPSHYIYNSTTPNLQVKCCLEIWQSIYCSLKHSKPGNEAPMPGNFSCMYENVYGWIMELQCHWNFDSRLLQLAIPGSKLEIQNLNSLNNHRLPSDHICKSTAPNMQLSRVQPYMYTSFYQSPASSNPRNLVLTQPSHEHEIFNSTNSTLLVPSEHITKTASTKFLFKKLNSASMMQIDSSEAVKG